MHSFVQSEEEEDKEEEEEEEEEEDKEEDKDVYYFEKRTTSSPRSIRSLCRRSLSLVFVAKRFVCAFYQ